MDDVTADAEEIADLVAAFFATFVSGPECRERADRLRELFLPGGIVVTATGTVSVEDLESFLSPRLDLLTGGRLTGFAEWAEDGHTQVHGDIAHWFGTYAKRGLLDGATYDGRGAKSLQLVRTPDGWRISAVAWSDDLA